MEPEKTYDVAVIGGGIAGAGVARDAVFRGLSVILFEKNTLGSGASSKSSKLIHGGLRYLELAWTDFKHLRWAAAFKNFCFVLSSQRESQILERTAPQLVRPLRLVVPVYQNTSRSFLSVATGTLLYGWLSLLTGGREWPKVHWGKEAARRVLPLLNPEGLLGAVEITDHTTDDLALVRAVAGAAQRSGAVIHEHASVTGWAWDASRQSYRLKVQKNKLPFFPQAGIFRARRIVHAAGPWIDRNRQSAGRMDTPLVSNIGGSHLELRAFLGKSAILEAQDGRVFFVIENGGRARVGTTEWPCNDPDHVHVPREDYEYLLNALRRYFPSLMFTRSAVLSADAGVRPLALDASAPTANRISREHRLTMDADGVFHLAGVKLTDHRRAAKHTVSRVFKSLRWADPGCTTDIAPL